MVISKRLAWMVVLLGLWAGPARAQEDYVKSLDAWHEHRLASLTAPDGWLSLAGLFWLEEGENRFGSDPSNRLVFPKGPARIGSYWLEKGSLRVGILPEVEVLTDGHPLHESVLDLAAPEGSSVLHCGTLSWYVIKREGRWGVRLKDEANPARTDFHGIQRYPADPNWRVEGRFEPHPKGQRIAVPNVLGSIDQEECPGSLVFEAHGQTCRLDPVLEEGETRLFVIFSDLTNGHGSYGGGRFLYVDPPDPQGRVVIDFNRAYNPPCAFTSFATCPRPPAQNRLPFPVEAGERAYGH